MAYAHRLSGLNPELTENAVDALRTEQRIDADGTAWEGLLIEASAENKQTHAIPDAVWTQSGSATITENTGEVEDPDGNNTASLIHVGDGTGQGVYKSAGAGSGGDPLAMSAWIRRKSTTGILLIGHVSLTLNGKWSVDLADLPDRWVRIDENFADKTIVTPFTQYADYNGIWLLGDGGTVDFYAWICQQEYGYQNASSSILTDTTTVVRAQDELVYPAQYSVQDGQGAIRMRFLAPTMTPDRNHCLINISNGGAADYIRVYVDTDGYLNFASAKTAGNAGAGQIAADICNNKVTEVLLSWRHNRMTMAMRQLDDTAETWATPDTSVDIPASLTEIAIGHTDVPDLHAGPIGIIDWKIYPRYLASFAEKGSGYCYA